MMAVGFVRVTNIQPTQPRDNSASANGVSPRVMNADSPPRMSGAFDPVVAIRMIYPEAATGAEGVIIPAANVPSEYVSSSDDSFLLKPLVATPFSSNGEQRVMLLAQATPSVDDYRCHGCGVLIGAGIFGQQGSEWKLVRSDGFISVVGQWGNAGQVEPLSLGAGMPAVSFSNTELHQGFSERTDAIIGVTSEGVRELIRIVRAGDTEGACGTADWVACYEFDSALEWLTASGSTAPDLLLRFHGTRPDQSGAVQKADEIVLYVFDGSGFTEQLRARSDEPAVNVKPNSSPSSLAKELEAALQRFTGDSNQSLEQFRIAAANTGASHSQSPRARALNGKALGLLRQNAYDRAISILELAIEADGLDAEVHENYGFAMLLAGRLLEAERSLLETLVLAPERQTAWLNLARLYAAKGQAAAACSAMRAFYIAAPDKDKARGYLHQLARDGAHTDLAKASLITLAWSKSS